MMIPVLKGSIESTVPSVFIQRLKQIYTAMDHAYDRAANNYGFTCDGCRDNCCRTRFYHHTLIEYVYLKEGLMTLKPEMQDQIKLRAMTVSDATEKTHDNQEAVRLMCPLNFAARCILYPYRPMICRLHGIPHELKKPGQQSIMGPGCETFNRRCSHKRYFHFERTPFYRDMAKLEQEVKQALGFKNKYKMSISQMIIKDA